MEKADYPVPCYNRIPNRARTPENEQLDFGWSRGSMQGGRSYYAEYWNEFGLDMMTYYFSARGLETLDTQALVKLLEAEPLIRIRKVAGAEAGPQVTSAKRLDEAGQEMWLVNVPFANEEDIWVECLTPIYGYENKDEEGK